jgi:hypothetical protein
VQDATALLPNDYRKVTEMLSIYTCKKPLFAGVNEDVQTKNGSPNSCRFGYFYLRWINT